MDSMDLAQATAAYRSPNRDDYPELVGYSRDEIYADCMGGGGLYLAARMVRTMHLRAGDIVLDLGCGLGATSVFLAREYGVKVVAVDLWTSATALAERIHRWGCRDLVCPLNLDVTQRLPFAEAYFDAMFCMNTLSFYGGSIDFLRHLLKHLRVGGEVCVGMESLNEECSAEARANPPEVYNYNLPPPNEDENVWDGDFSRMHSPPWWQSLFESSDLIEITHCAELHDATVLYEDLVLYQIDHGLDPEDVERSIAQIEYGRQNRPYKTLFVLTGRKS
jgi:SAM-dependent methyltransferase